jgi:taurine dioxygenase
MSTHRELDIRPLCDAFGIEVRGVSLAEDLHDETIAIVRELFDAHHLLLFRDQQFSGDDQLRVCRALRPVADPVAWVSNVEPGFHPESELLYHCDFAFTPNPMLGLSLYAVELAEGAAPTRFASNVRACASLSEALRAQLADLEIVHVVDTVKGRDNRRTRLDDVGGDAAPHNVFARFARPAIWTHPVLGVPLLFILQQQASHFVGWSCDASDQLIGAAFDVLYEPANVYEHHWRVGDFAVWDNLAVQHGRPANPNTVRRSLRRVAMNTVTTAELIAGTGFDPVERAKRQRMEVTP